MLDDDNNDDNGVGTVWRYLYLPVYYDEFNDRRALISLQGFSRDVFRDVLRDVFERRFGDIKPDILGSRPGMRNTIVSCRKGI